MLEVTEVGHRLPEVVEVVKVMCFVLEMLVKKGCATFGR
jgi:hypothetical protein